MSQIFPYMNQLRFRRYGVEIDYVDNLPALDYMKPRINYERDILPADYYPIYQAGKEISLQISLNTTKVRSAAIFSNGILLYHTSIVAADTFATNINQTINQTGIYYYIITLKIDNVNTTFISDEFKVVEWADKKDLVKFTYSDTNNDNGGRFYNSSGDLIWNPSVYYTGTLGEDKTQYDSSVFTSQQNNLQVIRRTPRLVNKVLISCIQRCYYANLSFQLTCNNIYVNNVKYAVESVGKFDPNGDKTDVGDVEIIISRNTNNNYQQFL